MSLRNSIRIAENKVVKIEKSKTIQLKGDDGLKKLVYFDQIAYVKSDNGGNDIYIWDKDTNQLNKYLDLHTLKSLENKLDNSIFWQVHRSYILNINFVDSYTYSDILLKYLDVKIPIGKTYRKEMTSKLSSL